MNNYLTLFKENQSRITMIALRHTFFSLLLPVICLSASAQRDLIDELLNERVAIENPVYKPVIAIGSGVINFHGDVRNNHLNPVVGNYGIKVNVSTFVDRKRFYKANFSLLYGQVSADQRSLIDLERNLNFKTDLIDFGVNLEYSFDHIFTKTNNIRPFVSLGLENIQFTPKGDLYDPSGNFYYYWSDGTIRDISQSENDIKPNRILTRDYRFETDLREREKALYGLGSYSRNTFSIPLDAGLDFRISDRVSCRLGTSLHFTFTDFMDNVSSSGTSIKGKKGNDVFSFNYFSIRLDLFSPPKTRIIERLFAEMEFDDIMYGDEDGDFVLDAIDECPGTPYGVAVDSLGCPLDTDGDGIPDYLDEEPDTPPGVWVDEKGRTITEEVYLESLSLRANAMARADIDTYFETIGKGYVPAVATEIPARFRAVDADGDGYISFEELLNVIDDYFDYKLNFTVEEIYELNNFFFKQ